MSPQRTPFALRGERSDSQYNVGAGENDCYGLTASAGGAWAAGRITDRTTDHTSPLVETLRNSAWSLSSTPNPGGASGDAGFGGISAAPNGEIGRSGLTRRRARSTEP